MDRVVDFVPKNQYPQRALYLCEQEQEIHISGSETVTDSTQIDHKSPQQALYPFGSSGEEGCIRHE
jgi:hypothetical protein